MDFNAKKCYVLRITHAKQPQKYTYTLNNSELQETQTHTYLGVDLSHDLTWNSHINRIATKANRTLGFLRKTYINAPLILRTWRTKPLCVQFWITAHLCGMPIHQLSLSN